MRHEKWEKHKTGREAKGVSSSQPLVALMNRHVQIDERQRILVNLLMAALMGLPEDAQNFVPIKKCSVAVLSNAHPSRA